MLYHFGFNWQSEQSNIAIEQRKIIGQYLNSAALTNIYIEVPVMSISQK